MRTTLDIDADVLQAAKELATLRGTTAGRILSELARRGLRSGRAEDIATRNGVPVIPRRETDMAGGRLTMARVNRLRDES